MKKGILWVLAFCLLLSAVAIPAAAEVGGNVDEKPAFEPITAASYYSLEGPGTADEATGRVTDLGRSAPSTVVYKNITMGEKTAGGILVKVRPLALDGNSAYAEENTLDFYWGSEVNPEEKFASFDFTGKGNKGYFEYSMPLNEKVTGGPYDITVVANVQLFLENFCFYEPQSVTAENPIIGSAATYLSGNDGSSVNETDGYVAFGYSAAGTAVYRGVDLGDEPVWGLKVNARFLWNDAIANRPVDNDGNTTGFDGKNTLEVYTKMTRLAINEQANDGSAMAYGEPIASMDIKGIHEARSYDYLLLFEEPITGVQDLTLVTHSPLRLYSVTPLVGTINPYEAVAASEYLEANTTLSGGDMGGSPYLTIAANSGDYLSFAGLDFGTGNASAAVLSLRTGVSESNCGGKIEIRKGGADGTVLGAVQVVRDDVGLGKSSWYVPLSEKLNGLQEITLYANGAAQSWLFDMTFIPEADMPAPVDAYAAPIQAITGKYNQPLGRGIPDSSGTKIGWFGQNEIPVNSITYPRINFGTTAPEKIVLNMSKSASEITWEAEYTVRLGDRNGTVIGRLSASEVPAGGQSADYTIALEIPEGVELTGLWDITLTSNVETVLSTIAFVAPVPKISGVQYGELTVEGSNASLTVKRGEDVTEAVTVIFAAYDNDGRLVAFVPVTKNTSEAPMASDEEVLFTGVLENAGTQVKAFVWNSIEGMKPYGAAV